MEAAAWALCLWRRRLPDFAARWFTALRAGQPTTRWVVAAITAAMALFQDIIL